MESKDVYSKLEMMSEQITKLRESSARTESLLSSFVSLKIQVDNIERQQNQWKGAVLAISAISSLIVSIVARSVGK